MKILFICKKNECYGFTTYTRRSSGLFNSTQFIVKGLLNRCTQAKIIEVVDNNCIDREVSAFKPDLVVIEALWVVPEKFDVLKRLHPKVRWFVHLHSHMPFLAIEGIAMQWIHQYADRRVGLIANSVESYDALRCLLDKEEVDLLPNVYIAKPMRPVKRGWSTTADIACFGAIRPMKNQLLQAMVAIRYAQALGKELRFHINASRIETGGEPVMKNLLHLFAATPGTKLVQHPWMEPEQFIRFLNSHIDIGMQVSMTETFNVVCADYVTAGVPVVASRAITWISQFCQADESSAESILKVMRRVANNQCLVKWNQKLLQKASQEAQQAWFDWAHWAMKRT